MPLYPFNTKYNLLHILVIYTYTIPTIYFPLRLNTELHLRVNLLKTAVWYPIPIVDSSEYART